MTDLTVQMSQQLVSATLEFAATHSLNPLAVVVLDTRGAPRAAAWQDGVSLRRADIAYAKAYGAIATGVGSRALLRRAQEQPHFIGELGETLQGAVVPAPGGVLMRNAAGALIGAVGVSGDTSDNDEEAAVAGILAIGLNADPGAASGPRRRPTKPRHRPWAAPAQKPDREDSADH